MKMPHNITIYNKLKEQYVSKKLRNVYYFGSDSINISGKGTIESGNINIIIDGENLKDYINYKDFIDSSKYTIQNGTRIVLGDGPDIKSLNDLDDSFKQITVFSFDENLVGSNLDNIVVVGK